MNLNKTAMPIDVEHMNAIFTKYHLNRDGAMPWPFRPVLHHFSGPDDHDPHDHPWPFTTYILAGGYVEEVFHIHQDADGPTWSSEIVERLPGTAHTIEAGHIHRIIKLPAGDCWTMVLAGPDQAVPHFYRFSEAGILTRPWHSDQFTPYTPTPSNAQ